MFSMASRKFLAMRNIPLYSVCTTLLVGCTTVLKTVLKLTIMNWCSRTLTNFLTKPSSLQLFLKLISLFSRSFSSKLCPYVVSCSINTACLLNRDLRVLIKIITDFCLTATSFKTVQSNAVQRQPIHFYLTTKKQKIE